MSELSPESFKISVDAMMDGFIVLAAVRDASGQVTDLRMDYWNASALREFSREPDQVLGNRCSELFPGFQSTLFFHQCLQVIETGTSQLIPSHCWDGQYYDVQLVKLHDGVMSVWRNVTDKVLAENRLSEQQRLMLHSFKMNALGQMAAEVSHEILTPLTFIVCKVYLLRRMIDAQNPEFGAMKEAIAEVETTSMRIRKIIDGLRSFSHADPEEPFEKESIVQIIQDTLVFCKQRFDRGTVSLNLDLRIHEPRIECRPSQIAEVLLNLLNNAYDAIENQPQRWIRVEASEWAKGVEIRVTDSGPGIPSEIRSKIFGAFYTTKPMGKGTGLGLSLSREIVERHHGSLELNPSMGNTQFVIRLPKRQPGPDQDYWKSADSIHSREQYLDWAQRHDL